MLDEYDRVCRPSALDETPCSVAEQRQHLGLNRYFNVLPFDFNRVRLQVGLQGNESHFCLWQHHLRCGWQSVAL